MRRKNNGKPLAALLISAMLLVPASAASAANGEAAAQSGQSQQIVCKEAEPKKLKDGESWKNLYEIQVKDNGATRSLLLNGMSSEDYDWSPSLLAVDGSHFCFTYKPGIGTLTSPEKIEGTVDGSDMEILFEYKTGGAGSGGRMLTSRQASYCDLYAKTKDGKAISGLSLYYNTDDGDINLGLVSAIRYGEDGEIVERTHWDGFSRIKSSRGINGYAQLTGWGTFWNGSLGQITPYLKLGRTAYAILDNSGSVFEDSCGGSNRYIWAFKTNESEDTFTVLALDGGKVADVIVRCHETDYYSTSAMDFEYDYEVENLADGWEVSVKMSETSAFPNSLETGESVLCDPALLMSITAARKSDDGLIPATCEFDGRQDLTFRFEGIEGIKEIKQVYFNCAENVQAAGSSWLGWVSYDGEDVDYDLEKGELTIPDISGWVYEKYPSVGNTYQGSMAYVTEDGAEKTAYGEWYIKVLERSDEPVFDISKAFVTLEKDNYVYDGKAKTPSVTVKLDGKTLAQNTDYTVSYSSNISVGTAKVTVTGKGNYTGSVTKNFTISKADSGITCRKTVYNVTYGAKPFTINATADGALTYSSSDSKVASVSKSGKVTVKGTGIAYITVKSGSDSLKVTVKVSPKKQTVKSAQIAKGRKLAVKWKKDKTATGYQIQISGSKNFKKVIKTIKTSKNAYTFTKLQAGSKYYIRLRSYKKSGKNMLYGAWSNPKRSGKVKK